MNGFPLPFILLHEQEVMGTFQITSCGIRWPIVFDRLSAFTRFLKWIRFVAYSTRFAGVSIMRMPVALSRAMIWSVKIKRSSS
jgi:hypothetical protein